MEILRRCRFNRTRKSNILLAPYSNKSTNYHRHSQHFLFVYFDNMLYVPMVLCLHAVRVHIKTYVFHNIMIFPYLYVGAMSNIVIHPPIAQCRRQHRLHIELIRLPSSGNSTKQFYQSSGCRNFLVLLHWASLCINYAS